MSNREKRFERLLIELGFYHDEEAWTKGRAYRHPNDPSQIIKVAPRMTDSAVTFLTRKANAIADTGHQGPREPQTVKERATITRRKQTEQQRREDEARRERAEKAEREYEARQRILEARRRQREIESLMRPGYGR